MPNLRAWPMDRDRSILLGGAALITSIAWLYLARMANPMHAHGHVHRGGAMDAGALFAMWAAMMVAMMLPSTLPFVFAFSGEQNRRHAMQLPLVPTLFFISGYFAVWTVFSGACAALQELLHRLALLSPTMALTSHVSSGLVLVAAGVYQWTPMKNACLRHCRSPLTFLLSDWREGTGGALLMGAGHGLFCIGCCWMLMLLPFAAGVMSLRWMAGITVLLILEKAVPGGELTARICGALLALVGSYLICFRVGV
jgi:predicted metal-binding membrane protein